MKTKVRYFCLSQKLVVKPRPGPRFSARKMSETCRLFVADQKPADLKPRLSKAEVVGNLDQAHQIKYLIL